MLCLIGFSMRFHPPGSTQKTRLLASNILAVLTRSSDFVDTPWRMRSPISIWRTQVGAIEVHYKREQPTAWEGPFLREEQELLDNIAHRIGEYLEWKQRELGSERLGAAPEHWRWRQRFAERIAASMNPARFRGRGGLPVRQHGTW